MATNYLVNGSMYVPAIQIVPGGLVGGVSVDIYSNVSLNPTATGALILDQVTIPAFTLYQTGMGLYFAAFATTAANVNSKTITFNFAGTGANGAAVTGGTTIASQTTTTPGDSLLIEGWVFKTGASAQTYAGYGTDAAVLAAPTTGTLTVTDTSAIQLNLVANPATTKTDLTVQFWYIQLLP